MGPGCLQATFFYFSLYLILQHFPHTILMFIDIFLKIDSEGTLERHYISGVYNKKNTILGCLGGKKAIGKWQDVDVCLPRTRAYKSGKCRMAAPQ